MSNFSSLSLRNIKLSLWLVFGIGIIFILISIIALDMVVLGRTINSTFFLSMGGAFVAASSIALILRVPSLLEDVNNSSINLFKNNEFLKRLSISELKELRTAATESAYLKSANSVNKSLSRIDDKIANLFLEPYFKSYIINVRCRRDGDFIKKIVSTDFVLKNPNKEKLNGLKYVKPRVVQKKIEGLENNEIRSLKSFYVLKDEGEKYIDLMDKFELKFDKFSEESSNYDTVSSIVPKDEKYLDDISFTDSLHIKTVEERVVEKSDNVYVRRVTNPVENFNINYSFDECNVELIGNGFGTFQDTKDGGINIFKDGNSIHISSKKWLLTGNGIIIVHNFNE